MASILIIDDDVTLLARLGDQLADAGHSVEKTGDLIHAQQLHDELRPDLVILEVRTGGDGGWELLARLSGETAVLVLSSAGREEDVVRGFSNGALDYVTKPYRSEELLARLRVRLAGLRVPLVDPARALGEPVGGPRTVTTKPLAPPGPRRRGGRRPEPADETIFMSEAEEMALLRTPPAAAAASASPPETPDADTGALGSRLRAERLRRHLTLVQVENEIKIRMSYLQAMEDEKFTLLPRGPVAVEMLRGYAGYLGLDAGALADEFRSQHYVDPVEPPRALGGSTATGAPPRWLVLGAAVLLALVVAAGAIYALDSSFYQNLPATLQALWAQILGLFGG